MISPRSSLHGALALIMLCCVLSRSLCQVVAEVNRRSYPTFGSVLRAFTTSSPTCGEASDSGKKTYFLVFSRLRPTGTTFMALKYSCWPTVSLDSESLICRVS